MYAVVGVFWHIRAVCEVSLREIMSVCVCDVCVCVTCVCVTCVCVSQCVCVCATCV